MARSGARRLLAHALAACGLVAALAAQSPEPAPVPATQPAPTPAAAPQGPTISDAFAAWLADGAKPDANKPLLAALSRDPQAGLSWLSAAHAGSGDDAARRKAIEQAERDFALAFVQIQRASDITFRGQYDGLAMLQPRVGEFFFTLLLDPPQWFPTTQRVQLVLPLRDLQPRMPDAERVEAVVRIADNERIEPEDLRRALAAMLWQWGVKEQGQREVARLVAATVDGEAEERMQATLALADFHNQLREYKPAAAAYRAAQAIAKSAKSPWKPLTWYSAACVHALVGDRDRALAAIEACAALLASPDLDSSLRLSKKMFDRDPELDSLRADARFSAAVLRAFPPVEPPKDEAGR
jgi:hypothetical protein